MEPFFKISDKVPHAPNGKCISFVGIQKVQQESTWTNGYLLSASMTSTMECSQCKVAENCLNPWTAGPTMDTFSQPGGKRGFQNFTIVNNAVNTYPLQLQEAVVSISLSFSSILSVGINIGCRRPPRLGLGLDSPVQKFNYTLQNLTHVGLVSVNIAFHNISKTPLFPAYIWSFDQFWAL